LYIHAVAYQRQVKASEKKMAKFMEEAHQQLDAGFELKAVFVTFNTQGEASKCIAGCPRSECTCPLEKFGMHAIADAVPQQ
jgi:hypothetical protein